MPKTQSDIFVNFCNYLPYDNVPYTCITLGKITTDQLNSIMDMLAKNTNRPHTCIQTISAEFTDTISFGRLPGHGTRHRSLDLSNLFYSYDVTENKTPAPCMIGKRQPKTEDAMLRTCAHNLKCGLCRDEFICRTLGTVLFPQKYVNEKQK